MTEREFDIQVRNLLQDAQEPVSPELWEGVAAGLARRRRAVILRVWGSVASVAAAAAVALFVFLRPSAPALAPEHSNYSSIFMSEESGEPLLPQEELVEVQVPRNIPRLAAAVPVSQPSPASPLPEPEVQEAPAPVQKASAPVPEKAAPAPEKAESAPEVKAQDANAALNLLAFEEKAESAPEVKAQDANAALNLLAFEAGKSAKKKASGFSMAAFGNLQTSQRVGIQGVYRRYGAPPMGSQEGVYNESPEVSFSLPFSVGVGFQWNFSPHWSLGTGIRYTNLQRTVVGNYKGDGFYLEQTDIDNRQHCIGVPFNVYYNFINKGRWNVHAFAGGGVEWLLDNHYLIHNNPSDIHYHQPKNGIPQFSAGAGLGVEFKITPVVGLYLDPSFRYFFATQKQPRSLRTVQPLRFDIEAGVRFSFGK